MLESRPMDLFSGPDRDVARAIGVHDDDGCDDTSSPASVSSVRPEYQRMVSPLLALCRDFGLTVSMVHELNFGLLMRSFESLDRYYDDIPDDKEAERFLEDVFLFLRSWNSVRPIRPLRLPAELIDHLTSLREVLLQTGTLNVFFDYVSRICQLSRDARKIQGIREYVRCSLSQGELTGELVSAVLDFDSPPEDFVPFMTYLAATGKLIDDYWDADTDYKKGEIAIKPGFAFKNYLRALLIKRVAWIVAHHPNKTRALRSTGAILRNV